VWNLIPISPFNEDDIRYKSTFKPLIVPGTFGREELLRPFHCCINKKKSPISAKKKKKKEPCHVCKSIQDIAKFIPRKDFWCFSYDEPADNGSIIGSSSSRMKLIVSGKNVAQLVSISSSSGLVRDLDKKLDEQTIHVYDGDILSLLWYNKQSSSSEADAVKASSKLETLVQFRLTKVEDEEDDTMNVAAKEESLSDNKVQVSILVNNSQERAAIENNGISNMMSDTKITAAESRDDHDSAKIDQVKDDDDESMQSDTHDLLYTQEDQMKQEDMHEDDDDSKKSGLSSHVSQKPIVNNVSTAAVPPCIGSVKSSSKDEYDSSAPLTLPYEFLASGGESKSYSFDSMDKSPTKLPIDKKDPSTPQKSNISGKRRYEDITSADQDTKVASKTPKKSNVTATDNSSLSTLLSSLTHNEMVKLHEQSAPQTNDNKPSLRHTVLSLTLALTSNASAYDSNFLRYCNVEKTTPNGDRQRNERQDAKQRWMPRFLQGTKIKLQGKKEED